MNSDKLKIGDQPAAVDLRVVHRLLGAGGVGICAALEIASRGFPVDVYDRDTLPVGRASYVNEGKIHQGLLYAKDPSRRTVDILLPGALAFYACLRRWLDLKPEDLQLSTPFIYAVSRRSMFKCTSSRSTDHWNAPLAISSRICASPRSIAARKWMPP